ncbi:MAG: hypothetical protein EA402_04900 [Planctomycetota bacterium]|nr:MAG: hypothetical protein EA402_04900 [Planctomycetota bacterium]
MGDQALALAEALQRLRAHDNPLMLELGSAPQGDIPWAPLGAAASWWDVVQDLSQHHHLAITPVNTGSMTRRISMPHRLGPGVEAYLASSRPEIARLQAETDMILRQPVIREAMALTSGGNRDALSYTHHGPWRIELQLLNRFQRRYLNGEEENWLELRSRVLGEPRLRDRPHLYASLIWQTPSGWDHQGLPSEQPLRLTHSPPELRRGETHANAQRGRLVLGRQQSATQEESLSAGANLFLASDAALPATVELQAQLILEGLRPWEAVLVGPANTWLPWMHGEDLYHIAIISDRQQTARLADELDLEEHLVRAPGVIMVTAAEDTADEPSWDRWQLILHDERERSQSLDRVHHSGRNSSDSRRIQWRAGAMHQFGEENLSLRISSQEVEHIQVIPLRFRLSLTP